AGGFMVGIEAWPLPADGLDAEEVASLTQRFFRVLVATRNQGHGQTVRTQLEEPIAEVEAARGPAQRLVLMADYLFERAPMRRDVLVAEHAGEVRDMVADALDLMEQGLPQGPGAVRGPMRAYLQEAAGQGLADMA